MQRLCDLEFQVDFHLVKAIFSIKDMPRATRLQGGFRRSPIYSHLYILLVLHLIEISSCALVTITQPLCFDRETSIPLCYQEDCQALINDLRLERPDRFDTLHFTLDPSPGAIQVPFDFEHESCRLSVLMEKAPKPGQQWMDSSSLVALGSMARFVLHGCPWHRVDDDGILGRGGGIAAGDEGRLEILLWAETLGGGKGERGEGEAVSGNLTAL